jgi:hypothetical protein
MNAWIWIYEAIMREGGEMIGKLRRDQRSGVRDQKKNELGWGRPLELGGWGLDI